MTAKDVGSPNDFMLCYWFTKILLSGHCLSGAAHCCWHAAHIYYLDKTEWSRVLEDRVSTVRKGVSTSCIHPWWYVLCTIFQAINAHWLNFDRHCILCVGWVGPWQIMTRTGFDMFDVHFQDPVYPQFASPRLLCVLSKTTSRRFSLYISS